MTPTTAAARTGRRIAAGSVAASIVLAAGNITTGILGGSTSVTAAGFEFLGDVLASAAVYAGLVLGTRPPDDNHPYGHGRIETLAGLAVGVILCLGGIGIMVRSLDGVGAVHPPPAGYTIWPLIGAIGLRGGMAMVKYRVGARIGSLALSGDAWNDAVDVLGAGTALAALGLTLADPERFRAADHYGGFAVGLVVVITGLRVSREASLGLMDTMPDGHRLETLVSLAGRVPGVRGVEKCLARRSGLQYHVDLHIEVDPDLSVRASHEIASAVRASIRAELEWVADVLVHVEPADLGDPACGPTTRQGG